jgi:hypothetical protein
VLIEGAVHHWDENGVEKGREEVVPEVISQVQGYELEFVRAWVDGEFCDTTKVNVGCLADDVVQTITYGVGGEGSVDLARVYSVCASIMI